MNKLKEIAIAWYNAANPTPEMKKVAESRLEICDSCDAVKKPKIGPQYCGDCGCPLNKKIFSPNGPGACPRKKWVV